MRYGSSKNFHFTTLTGKTYTLQLVEEIHWDNRTTVMWRLTTPNRIMLFSGENHDTGTNPPLGTMSAYQLMKSILSPEHEYHYNGFEYLTRSQKWFINSFDAEMLRASLADWLRNELADLTSKLRV